MERRGQSTNVSPSEKTIPNDPERTVVAPRFDRKSIQSAQPAVPLRALRKTRRQAGPLAFVALCVVAGLGGGLLGVLLLSNYQRGTPQPAGATIAPTTGAQPAPEPVAQNPTAEAVAPPSTEAEPAREDTETTSGEAAEAPDADASATLRGALDEWVAATNARDISKQMSFYNSRVNAFYLARNTTREAVRAEKARVLGAAESVDVRADAPDIKLSRDGRTAVMRFRKKYSIAGGAGERRGEVLQELRWQRTPDGWKIVSERDLRVLQ